MRIIVVGSGYVGLVTWACFAESGVNVTCVDVDVRKGKLGFEYFGMGEGKGSERRVGNPGLSAQSTGQEA